MTFLPSCYLGDLTGPQGNYWAVTGAVRSCLKAWHPTRVDEWHERVNTTNEDMTYIGMLRTVEEFVKPVIDGDYATLAEFIADYCERSRDVNCPEGGHHEHQGT